MWFTVLDNYLAPYYSYLSLDCAHKKLHRCKHSPVKLIIITELMDKSSKEISKIGLFVGVASLTFIRQGKLILV